MQSAMSSAERVFQLLDQPVPIASPAQPRGPAAVRGRIEFEHVWFAYQRRGLRAARRVVHRRAGREDRDRRRRPARARRPSSSCSTASTTSQRGRVLVDGVDVREWDLAALRRHIGVVLQDVFLFSGTIASNITLERADVTRETAIARGADGARGSVHPPPAARLRRARARARQQPLGRPAPAARVRARAGLRPERSWCSTRRRRASTPRPSCSSRTRCARLLRGRTALVIAHRLSTIEHADRIIVLHGGEIRESGTHAELLQQRGLYYRLYQLQYARAASTRRAAAARRRIMSGRARRRGRAPRRGLRRCCALARRRLRRRLRAARRLRGGAHPLAARSRSTELLARPTSIPHTRAKLELVLAVRRFAADELGLAVGGSYASVAHVDAGQVVHVVTAAPRDRLVAVHVVVPDRRPRAVPRLLRPRPTPTRWPRELEHEGYDTYVRPAVAFSTLGWFDDPLLSTLLRYDERTPGRDDHPRAAAQHDLRARPDARSTSRSRPSSATAAPSAFFVARGDAARAQRAAARWADALTFSAVPRPADRRASSRPTRAAIADRSAQALFARAQREFAAQPWQTSEYAGFGDEPLNNAVILHDQLYADRLQLFDDGVRPQRRRPARDDRVDPRPRSTRRRSVRRDRAARRLRLSAIAALTDDAATRQPSRSRRASGLDRLEPADALPHRAARRPRRSARRRRRTTRRC